MTQSDSFLSTWKGNFALLGDHRRLTAREKRQPESILNYPKDHEFKMLHNTRYGKHREEDQED